MSGQRGVALLTALLVLALATTVAVTMSSRQQLDIRRSANLLQADQAWLYALGIEDWAGQVLRRDRIDNQRDSLGEDWATILPPMEVEGGQVAGTIEDLQGLFNLNNLVADGKPVEYQVQRLRRLLTALELEPDLAAAVVDWIDPNIDVTVPGGAEDETYLSLAPPYRAANRPMVSPSELRLVNGFTPKIYHALRPYVCTLPGATAINVNTAPAPVLMALGDGVTKSDAEALVEARGEDGFESVDTFLTNNALAGREVDQRGLDVASSYFVVTSDVLVDRINLRMQSVVMREASGAVRTLLRAQGNY